MKKGNVEKENPKNDSSRKATSEKGQLLKRKTRKRADLERENPKIDNCEKKQSEKVQFWKGRL